jgi:purine-binding chemotaxis protein CheW
MSAQVNKKINIRQEIKAVGFYVGDDEYAVYIHNVREIYPMTEIRKIPKAPMFVEGVINLRGVIIPIIDLRKRFDMTPSDLSKTASKILIVELDKNLIGLIVDNVSEVMNFYLDEIEKAPPVFSSNIDSQYIQGVAKIEEKLVILLDIEKLLSFEEKTALKSFA